MENGKSRLQQAMEDAEEVKFIMRDNVNKTRLQQAQEDAEEVKDIMMDNLKKSEERRDKLEDLEGRAEELFAKSKTFEKSSNQVKQKKMWENKRTKIIMIVVAVVVALVLFGAIIWASVG